MFQEKTTAAWSRINLPWTFISTSEESHANGGAFRHKRRRRRGGWGCVLTHSLLASVWRAVVSLLVSVPAVSASHSVHLFDLKSQTEGDLVRRALGHGHWVLLHSW